MRMASVFTPRRARKLSNGPAIAPTEFCRKPSCSRHSPGALRAHHGDAADDVRVAVQVLGGRVHHDVEAVFQRALDQRAGEGVVGHGDDAPFAADLGDRLQIRQLEHGIGRRLDPHHPGFRRRRPAGFPASSGRRSEIVAGARRRTRSNRR
jgi:hypothetical protein